MQLKAYQHRSLDTLAEYFRLVVEDERTPTTPGRVGAQTAFELLFSGRPYFHVPGLDGMPYVCLRVPTGGGKTVMASHAVGIAARDFCTPNKSSVFGWFRPMLSVSNRWPHSRTVGIPIGRPLT
jgi:type III restriction enzyme